MKKEMPAYTKDVQDCIPSPPKISYDRALRSWFVYQGIAYEVRWCAQDIFDAFLLECVADWTEKQRALHLLFDAPPDDVLLTRWYNLDVLRMRKVPGLVLYDTEPEVFWYNDVS